MAVAQLTAVPDGAGAVLRASLPTTALIARPLLTATDPATGEALFVVETGEAAGLWQWKVESALDRVLVLATDEATIKPLPVLLNTRVRKVLARVLKHVGRAEGCRDPALHEALAGLRHYHALAGLLFAAGDYAGCALHLQLLADLEPGSCPCSCAR